MYNSDEKDYESQDSGVRTKRRWRDARGVERRTGQQRERRRQQWTSKSALPAVLWSSLGKSITVQNRLYLDDPILGDTWGQCGLNCFLLLSFYLFCQHWVPYSLGRGFKLWPFYLPCLFSLPVASGSPLSNAQDLEFLGCSLRVWAGAQEPKVLAVKRQWSCWWQCMASRDSLHCSSPGNLSFVLIAF